MVKRLTNPLEGRPLPLGSLINRAGLRLATALDEALRDAGFDDLRGAHAPVFMAIDAEGSRTTELASRTQMSKQAMGELVRYLRDRGYVDVKPDPADGRARLVTLTARGWKALDTGVRVIDSFDAWLLETIGAGGVTRLRHTLTRIIELEAP
jgi:DNA-binding MarR family transcriptional regulator